MLLFVLAASVSPLDACVTAVRNDLPSAAQACVLPPPMLKPGADPTDPSSYGSNVEVTHACGIAIEAGRKAGKFGARLPAGARAGLIRDFEKKLAGCENPVVENAVPVRGTVNLWD